MFKPPSLILNLLSMGLTLIPNAQKANARWCKLSRVRFHRCSIMWRSWVTQLLLSAAKWSTTSTGTTWRGTIGSMGRPTSRITSSPSSIKPKEQTSLSALPTSLLPISPPINASPVFLILLYSTSELALASSLAKTSPWFTSLVHTNATTTATAKRVSTSITTPTSVRLI